MAVLHQPADHLVQGALVGHVELLGVVGALLLGVAAHRGAGAAADLGDAQAQQLRAHGLGLPGRDYHAGIGHRKAYAGGDMGKDLVVDAVVELVGVDVIGPL